MKYDKMILGNDFSVTMDCDITQTNNNVIVVGTSGCGKSMSITETNLLYTEETSVVASFAKRARGEKYIRLFANRGYEVIDLNFADPLHSAMGYDPMDYITSYDDISFLARTIVSMDDRGKGGKVDPYWDQTAISLLSALIAHEVILRDKATMKDVIDLFHRLKITSLMEVITTSLDADFDELEKRDFYSYAVTMWKTFKSCPLRTALCVLSSLSAIIDTAFCGECINILRKKDKIDFKKISEKRVAVFITTSAVNPALNVFVNVFYSQMFKELFEIREKDTEIGIPIRIICDDFACGAKIYNFHEYISICREERISITVMLQSESQLQSMYGEYEAQTILNNADTYVYMGGNDVRTAEHIAKRAGKNTLEILYMPVGKEVIFRRGESGPIMVDRYDLLNDRKYLSVFS